MKKKIVILSLALVLAFALGIGGTLAWLTASTTSVTNTFTVGDISVTLSETPNYDSNKDGTNDTWQAQLIPGYTYAKDPKVTVSGNVDCYLFVKFEETNNPSKYLDYTSTLSVENSGWTQGKGNKTNDNPDGDGVPTNVWYREVKANDTTKAWNLLEGNATYSNGYVTVKSSVTKNDMPAEADAPKLTYAAYVCQLNKNNNTKFTAAEAWTNAQSSGSVSTDS